MRLGRSISFALGLTLAAIGGSQMAGQGIVLPRGSGWPTHGGNASHSASSLNRAQDLKRVVWSTPLDLAPQYNGDVLYAHYGSPVVSPKNVVVIPVKTGANGGFRIEAREGAKGTLIWQQNTDYVTPEHGWYPTLGPTLTGEEAAYARKAGLVSFRAIASATATPRTICFYGQKNYDTNPAAYDAAVRISSPLVTDEDGSIYFTYRVEGSTPLGLKGGIAFISRNGKTSYLEGAAATGDPVYYRPKLNAAPAVGLGVVYAVFKSSGSEGMLVGINTKSFKTIYKAPLVDPKNNIPSYVDDDGTACPAVGPDGDVYFGVLESPFGSHHYRGWLLHFNRGLTQVKTPASFGWDDTPSLVPRYAVPGYHGDSQYLVLVKYNNYVGQGDGVNRIALLDPGAVRTDPYSGVESMKEVHTQIGPTPDWNNTGNYPNAVREWCINTAAIDLVNHVAMVNNEDGVLYRWNLNTNTLDQSVRLNSGIGQAYTPTAIGPTGLVFAVSNARLYAVGK